MISLRAEEPAALELAAELEATGVPTRIPTVIIDTAGCKFVKISGTPGCRITSACYSRQYEELYVGVGAGTDPTENARAYETLAANKPVVELDENISRRAGVLEGEHLESHSKPALGPTDAVVAATGLVLNEPVVTSDSDFESVDGLAVELC